MRLPLLMFRLLAASALDVFTVIVVVVVDDVVSVDITSAAVA